MEARFPAGVCRLLSFVDGIVARLGGDDGRGNNHTDKREGNQQIMHCVLSWLALRSLSTLESSDTRWNSEIALPFRLERWVGQGANTKVLLLIMWARLSR